MTNSSHLGALLASVTYELKFTDNIIKVLSETNRAEFAPEVLYINEADKRANIDFGVSLLELSSNGKEMEYQT